MPGKRGNTNALKHGLYAQCFTDPEKAHLGKMPTDDLRPEIALLRVIANQIAELLHPTQKPPQDGAADEEQPKEQQAPKPLSIDDTAKLTNSLTNAVTAINTSMRTQALLQGTYNPLDDAIDQALKGFDPDQAPHEEDPDEE